MKKLYFYLVITMIVFATSCGTTKKTASPIANGDVLIQTNLCEEYAMQKPAQRASGVGQHFQEITARNQAELQARATLARALQTCIEATIKDYADGTTLFSANDTEGASVSDQSALLNDRIEGMSKELIKGALVVKMEKYKTTNNQYKVYVCIEYSDEVAQMVGKVAKSFGEMLTEDQKLRVKFNELQFKTEMEKKMQEYKGVTMQ